MVGLSPSIRAIPVTTLSAEQFFGSSMDTVASHVSSIIGPVPSYNGPCQCKACTAVLQRLRQFMFEWGHFGPKEINEEIDNRFCFGERRAHARTRAPRNPRDAWLPVLRGHVREERA